MTTTPTPDALSGLRGRIDEEDNAHPFAPGIHDDSPCAVCQDDESALAHISDHAERERQRAVILDENGYHAEAAAAELLADLLDGVQGPA